MRNAVNNFQKQLFIILLYASTFSGVLADIALSGGRTMLYVAFDGQHWRWIAQFLDLTLERASSQT